MSVSMTVETHYDKEKSTLTWKPVKYKCNYCDTCIYVKHRKPSDSTYHCKYYVDKSMSKVRSSTYTIKCSYSNSIKFIMED